MAKKVKNESCCAAIDKIGYCKVESLMSVDERGQMVLPKEIREKAGIRAGDKMVVISWGKNEQIYCISLIKADNFSELVKELLGPMFKEMIDGGGKK